MSKQKIEIEVDVPEGYEATGEYRIPYERNDYWLGDFGVASGPSSCHRIILRKLPDPIPEVEGPIGWPELKWAAKSPDDILFVATRIPVSDPTQPHHNGYQPNQDSSWFYVEELDTDWTPPPEIADLPPEKSLVKLTHECRWTFRDGEWIPSCTECYWNLKPTYCPECGRKVKGEAQ